MDRFKRLPEVAVAYKDCADPGFIFASEAKIVFNKMDEIIESFSSAPSDAENFYYNNVIGIMGGRGSGKSSLMASITATIDPLSSSFRGTPIDLARRYRIPSSRIPGHAVYCLSRPIDPKSIPNCIGIVDLVLAALFYDFRNNVREYTEDSIDSIFQKFEDANRIASLLSQKQRNDVLNNPSDLFDLASLTQLNIKISELIRCLLDSRKDDNSMPNKRTFLVCIDDFDLDAANCYKMAIEISTFLNIKGLIILLAMDPAIFDKEVERNRIKELSDYGNVTRELLSRPLSRVAASTSSADSEVPSLGRILRDARKYRSHLEIKLIPLDFRVKMKAHGIGEGHPAILEAISYLCEWLFGFSDATTFVSGKERFKAFLLEFKNRLLFTSELRSRNQMLNCIIDVLEERDTLLKKNSNSASSEEDSSFLAAIAESFLNYPDSDNSKNKIDLKSMASALTKTLKTRYFNLSQVVQDDSDGRLEYFDDYLSDKANNHPCWYLAYSAMASKLNIFDRDLINGIFDLMKGLEELGFFKVGIKVSDLEKVNGRDSFRIGNFLFDNESVLALHPAADSAFLLTNIQEILRSPKRATKTKVLSVLSDLIAYAYINDSFDEEDVREYRELRIKASEVSPWKGDSEGKSAFFDRALPSLKRALRRIK